MTNEPNNQEPSSSSSSPSEPVDPTTGATATLPPIPPAIPPQPVVAHSRRRNRPAIIIGLIAAALAGLLIALIAAVAIGVAVIVGIASGDITVEADRVDVALMPATLAELPSSIVEENGAIEIDLTEVDTANLDATDAPVELDVQADFGAITVIVPDELDVSVEASSDIGDVTVFGNSDDGFGNTVIHETDNADLTLDLDLNVGKIEVRRG